MLNLNDPGIGENAPAARAQRETYWRRLIARWQASGLPQGAFSEREGVSGATMHWWLRELTRRDVPCRTEPPQPFGH